MSENEKKSIFNELKAQNKQKKHHATIQCVSSKNSDGIFNLESNLEERAQEKISNDLKRSNYTINIKELLIIHSKKLSPLQVLKENS